MRIHRCLLLSTILCISASSSDGKTVENTRAVGLVKDIGASEVDAWLEVGRLGLDKNVCQNSEDLLFRDLVKHFRQHELKKTTGIAVKAEETVDTAELLLDRWTLPRPAAVKAGVIPKEYRGRFGWHNLRHSLATRSSQRTTSTCRLSRVFFDTPSPRRPPDTLIA